jgi:hypothetical protein
MANTGLLIALPSRQLNNGRKLQRQKDFVITASENAIQQERSPFFVS